MNDNPTAASVRSSSPLLSSGLWKAGAIAAVLAAVVNAIVWAIGKAADVPYDVTQSGTTSKVAVYHAIVASVSSVAVATIGAWLLRRFPWGMKLWTALLAVGAVVTTPGPFNAADSNKTAWTLIVMHVVVLAAIWFIVRPAAHRKPR